MQSLGHKRGVSRRQWGVLRGRIRKEPLVIWADQPMAIGGQKHRLDVGVEDDGKEDVERGFLKLVHCLLNPCVVAKVEGDHDSDRDVTTPRCRGLQHICVAARIRLQSEGGSVQLTHEGREQFSGRHEG